MAASDPTVDFETLLRAAARHPLGMAEDGDPGDRSPKKNAVDRVGVLLWSLLLLGQVSWIVSRYVFDRRDRIFFVSYFVIWTVGWAVWFSVRRRQMRRPRR